jgi:signal peptidase I
MVSKSKIKTAGKIRDDPIPTAKTTGGAKTWRDFSLVCLIVLIIFMAYIPATNQVLSGMMTPSLRRIH